MQAQDNPTVQYSSVEHITGNMTGQQTPTGRVNGSVGAQNYPHTPAPNVHVTHGDPLDQAMNGLHLQGHHFLGHPGVHGVNGTPSRPNGLGPLTPMNTAFVLPTGQLYIPGSFSPYAPVGSQTMLQHMGSHYNGTVASQYHGVMSPQQIFPVTPQSQDFSRNVRDLSPREVPGLTMPRDSLSSNEEDTPRTSYLGTSNQSDHHINTSYAVVDCSPTGSFGHATPSPQQYYMPFLSQPPAKVPREQAQSMRALEALAKVNPPIPKPVPAVFTEEFRTLEQSLANPLGTTNVYIRGFQPDTTDDMLEAFAKRYGHLVSSKAIIDLQSGLCKGYGFARYNSYPDAENCIRGFFYLGYEVSFARESFNTQMQRLSDVSSTNLYVSNLPSKMTEAELEAVFIDFKVLSSRILRDSNGQSRGVGFARFESREVCDEVIVKFHGQAVGDEGNLLQVRYSDTDAQKKLKQETNKRRQFRTNEYNAVAYGGTDFYPYQQPGEQVLPHVVPVQQRVYSLSPSLPVTPTTSGFARYARQTSSSFGSKGKLDFDEKQESPASADDSHSTQDTSSPDGNFSADENPNGAEVSLTASPDSSN